MLTAFIGIGSNQGDRVDNCLRAVDKLRATRGIEVMRVSHWYLSTAVPVAGGPAEAQSPYINGAALLRTTLSAHELLAALIETERAMGRPHPRQKGTARTIDLDILLYGDEIIDEPDLVVPHPELCKRPFVLAPLCDIAPDTIEPKSGLCVRELLTSSLPLVRGG
ncbi:MAG: 2-amino-4-hydroxy-6-hydroxymethyldihydropteridine diphosphokinase [bacterium]